MTHSAEIRTPWPIVKSHEATLSDADQKDIRQVVSDIEANLSARSVTPRLSCGWEPGPTLYFEDHRGTALVSERSARRFEYRMLGLAGGGDLYAVTSPRDVDHETYIQTKIDQGAPSVLALDPATVEYCGDLALACLEDRAAFDVIVNTSQTARGLNIAPYQMSPGVWALARAIARASDQNIRIVGPPMAVSRLANDKVEFAALVSRLLGENTVPQTHQRATPIGLAKYLSSLAMTHATLVIKHPASAGGLGNLKISSNDLLAISAEARPDWIQNQIIKIGWQPGQMMLAGVWIDQVSLSPSVQIWVPLRTEGPPIIEGLFSQAVKGRRAAFSGASRIELDTPVSDLMVNEASRIARVYQALDYFGRLSLDAVILDEAAGGRRLKWIEANARWGGVSIPMTICNWMAGGREPCDFEVIQEWVRPDHPKTCESPGVIRLLPKNSGLCVALRLRPPKLAWSTWT